MICNISRKIIKIKWPDIRHYDITSICEIPNNTLLATHGVYGYAAFHVGVHLHDGIIVEFLINHGMKKTNLSKFMNRCITDNEKCNDPELGPKIRVYSIDTNYLPSRKECSKFNLPEFTSVESRVGWLFKNIHKEDYRLSTLNCEHVARWILCGRAYCIQTKYIKVPNEIINYCIYRSVVLSLLTSCIFILIIILLKIRKKYKRHQIFHKI